MTAWLAGLKLTTATDHSAGPETICQTPSSVDQSEMYQVGED